MHSGDITLEENGLYILLSDLGYEKLFHWGFYLALKDAHGVMLHVINGPQTENAWEYQTKPCFGVPNSLTLLLAMKIAVIDPILHDSLAERLAAIPVRDSARYGPVTCRVWLKEALEELDQEGYIALKGRVSEIEQETVDAAAYNRIRKQRTVEKSAFCL